VTLLDVMFVNTGFITVKQKDPLGNSSDHHQASPMTNVPLSTLSKSSRNLKKKIKPISSCNIF